MSGTFLSFFVISSFNSKITLSHGHVSRPGIPWLFAFSISPGFAFFYISLVVASSSSQLRALANSRAFDPDLTTKLALGLMAQLTPKVKDQPRCLSVFFLSSSMIDQDGSTPRPAEAVTVSKR